MNLRHQHKRNAALISSRHFGDAAFPICALILIAALAVTTAIGCGWSFLNERSVRFSGYTSPAEFTRLPPLPIKPVMQLENANIGRNVDDAEYAEYAAGKRREKEMTELWAQARDAEANGQFDRSGS